MLAGGLTAASVEFTALLESSGRVRVLLYVTAAPACLQVRACVRAQLTAVSNSTYLSYMLGSTRIAVLVSDAHKLSCPCNSICIQFTKVAVPESNAESACMPAPA